MGIIQKQKTMDTPNQVPETTPPLATPPAVDSNAQELPLSTPSGDPRKRLLLVGGGVFVVAILVVATIFGGGMFKGSLITGAELKVELNELTPTNGILTVDYTVTNGATELPASNDFVMRACSKDDKVIFEKPWNLDKKTTMRAGESVTYHVLVPASELKDKDVTAVSLKLFDTGKAPGCSGAFSQTNPANVTM